MEENKLRKKIQEINNSQDDQKIKNKKIFELMNQNFKKKEQDENGIQHQQLECTHYKRKCNIMSPCCQIEFPCRLCHDENSDHQMNRFDIKQIICRECNFLQNTGNKCVNCSVIFANYHCEICNLWLDNEVNPVFHCHDCGICRKGNKEDFFHCKKCNLCINKSKENQHKCVENTANSNCPCCNNNLFNSTESITVLQCGHTIHCDCLMEYTKYNYECPICKKSLCDLSDYWKQIDAFLEINEMPEEYRNTNSNIFCNDCENKSTTIFHFIYHKCKECGGYNTVLI